MTEKPDISKLEEKIKSSSFAPRESIEAAAELAINHWKEAHDNMLKYDIELAKVHNMLGEQNSEWTEAKIMRVAKVSPAYENYVRARNWVRRIEELIRIAKKYVDVERY